MNDQESYAANMLAFERNRAKGNYPEALKSIDMAIDYCSDPYALCTVANTRKETAEKVKAMELSSFAKWRTKARWFWKRDKAVSD